jgi:hypothetical protein
MRGSPLQTPGNVRIVVLIHVGGNAVSFEKWQLAPVNCTEATEASVEGSKSQTQDFFGKKPEASSKN